MKVTLDLPDHLFQRAQAAAAERGCTLQDLVIEALTEKLAAVAAAPQPAAIDGRKALASRLQQLPDGSFYNPDGIDDEEFFRNLEKIRSGRWD